MVVFHIIFPIFGILYDLEKNVWLYWKIKGTQLFTEPGQNIQCSFSFPFLLLIKVLLTKQDKTKILMTMIFPPDIVNKESLSKTQIYFLKKRLVSLTWNMDLYFYRFILSERSSRG
jgi:hypothetical protein